MTGTIDDDPAGPRFPPGRYGRRRSPRRLARWRSALGVVIGAAVGLGVTVALYQRYGDPQYRPRVVGFALDADRATVRFDVRKPANAAAVCLVRARDRAGTEVGAAQVSVPAGTTEVTYELHTTGRPVTAEVPRCRPA